MPNSSLHLQMVEPLPFVGGLRYWTLAVTAALALGAAVAVPSGCRPVGDRPDRSAEGVLQSAARYLWAQQAEDGGWHSATHGILRGGEAWTPFTAFYLFQVPDSVLPRPEGRMEAALSFLREHVNADGVIGLSDPAVMEYPNYATSYGLRVMNRWGEAPDSSLVRAMVRYLQRQQFVEYRGIDADHLAYGAWGFGETGIPAGQTGHVDLSHTRRVLEGLRSITGAAGVMHTIGASTVATVAPDVAGTVPALQSYVPPTRSQMTDGFEKAQHYLRILQKHPDEARAQPRAKENDPAPPFDGGFYASTTALGTNKAGLVPRSVNSTPSYYGSYATTTCDGVLALLASGVPATDDRVVSAREWLLRHDSLETVPGIPPGRPGDWDQVLFFYHLLVRAEAYAALGVEGEWRLEIARILAGHQRPDGSFTNPMGAPNKEDDPILATTMAVGALLGTMR